MSHFATAYPGSEWYYKYKDSIIRQYFGVLEDYIKDLGDASKITGVISENFTGLELLGLQQIVASWDLRLLDQAEKNWVPPSEGESVAIPQESTNFVRKKIKAPVSKEKTSIYLEVTNVS
jgi:anaerobic magnesium-protoporphyrin IX monomethyl ester cyclase